MMICRNDSANINMAGIKIPINTTQGGYMSMEPPRRSDAKRRESFSPALCNERSNRYIANAKQSDVAAVERMFGETAMPTAITPNRGIGSVLNPLFSPERGNILPAIIPVKKSRNVAMTRESVRSEYGLFATSISKGFNRERIAVVMSITTSSIIAARADF